VEAPEDHDEINVLKGTALKLGLEFEDDDDEDDEDEVEPDFEEVKPKKTAPLKAKAPPVFRDRLLHQVPQRLAPLYGWIE
jgi:hypothetical protein